MTYRHELTACRVCHRDYVAPGSPCATCERGTNMINETIADAGIAALMLSEETRKAAGILLGLGATEQAVEMSLEAYALRCEARTLVREAGA